MFLLAKPIGWLVRKLILAPLFWLFAVLLLVLGFKFLMACGFFFGFYLLGRKIRRRRSALSTSA